METSTKKCSKLELLCIWIYWAYRGYSGFYSISIVTESVSIIHYVLFAETLTAAKTGEAFGYRQVQPVAAAISASDPEMNVVLTMCIVRFLKGHNMMYKIYYVQMWMFWEEVYLWLDQSIPYPQIKPSILNSWILEMTLCLYLKVWCWLILLY